MSLPARLRPEVAGLPAYNAGMSSAAACRRLGLPAVVKLSSNENPYGPSERAIAALAGVGSELGRYPDAQCTALRERLAVLTGVAPERLVFGNGSEDILQMICLATLCRGDRVLTLAPPFGLHEIFPRMMGATVEKVPLSPQLGHDMAAWRAALARPARLVFVGTPANPAGCVLDDAQLRALVAAIPPDCLIVVDEAYFEYAQGPGYADSLAVLSAQERPWIVLRTFSKAHGLAGLRVGYGMASGAELVGALDRVRTPFPVNVAAQAAALAALADRAHLERVVALTVAERARLQGELLELERRLGVGLRVAPSRGNFLFIDVRRPGVAVAEALLARGVIVKAWRDDGFDDFIRVSVGTPGDSTAFLAALAAEIAAPRAPARGDRLS